MRTDTITKGYLHAMSILYDLFLTFAKVGLFTFGGGYAMIAVIEDICVTRKAWITHDEMMNLTVIAESTPGPIAINCATYVGYKMGRMAGAVAATLGIVLPSFAVICLIAACMDNLMAYPIVAQAFMGIKVAVGILILDAGLNMLRRMPKKRRPRIFAGCAFAAMLLINVFSLRISSIALMLFFGTVSLALYLFMDRRAKGGERA